MDAEHRAGAGGTPARLRVALVGAGLVGQAAHVMTLAEDRARFDLVAVVDPSATVHDGVAARYGIPHATATLAEAAALGLDAVVVAVPGFGTIAQQRATVQARIQSTYGLTLAPGDVARLVNGDTVTGLPGTPKGDRVRLAGTGHHVYILIGTPASSSRTLELPHS